MSATITVEVNLPDGSAAPGSDISIFDESMIYKDAIDWTGTADGKGICTWEDMATGALGDMYIIKAKYTDPKNGNTFIGEKKARVKKSQTIKVYLRQAHIGEVFQLKISQDDLKTISVLPGGEELHSVIKELSVATEKKLSHASVMLESYIVEFFIRTKLRLDEKWKDNYEKLPLGALLDKEDIEKLLGPSLFHRVSILNEFRTAAVHPKEVGSYFEEAALGLTLIKDLIKLWFKG